MIRKLFFLNFILICFLINAQPVYFSTYKQLADSLGKAYQIPPCIILGVAFQESGGGKSQVAIHLNNHFGIKGNNAGIKDLKFKSKHKYFATVLDCYIAFCNILSKKKYYEELKGKDDIEKWLTAIAAGGYAGNNKAWKPKVLKVIQKFCKK